MAQESERPSTIITGGRDVSSLRGMDIFVFEKMHRELLLSGEVRARGGGRGAQGDARSWTESVRTSANAT